MRLEEIFSEKVTENGDIAFNKVGDNTLINILFLTEYYQKHINEVPTLGYSDKEQMFLSITVIFKANLWKSLQQTN